MLRITDKAIKHLERLRQDRGLDQGVGVRFVRHGPRVRLTFAPAALAGDRIVPRKGMALYLAPEVADSFEHAVVDATTTEERTRLVIRPQRSGAPARQA